MFILYNFLLMTIGALALPYLLFKVFFFKKYQKGFKERLGFLPQTKIKKLSSSKKIWMHAVSVGEAAAVFPLYTELKIRYPNFQIIFSTTTQTGQEWVQERLRPDDVAIYFPIDLFWSVKRVLGLVEPQFFISVETEIWPNFWWWANRKNIPVMLMNGRLSDRSFRSYLRIHFFMKHVLSVLSLVSCQTQDDANRYIKLGAPKDRVVVGGNLKFEIFDKTERIGQEARVLKGQLKCENDLILMGGSTHEGEEEILIDCFQALSHFYSNLKLILAPRHPERFNYVENLVRQKGYRCLRESELDLHPWSVDQILLIDSMGKLSLYYSLATVVFIGKSLTAHGGQNLLEPAAFGKVIFFGPHMENFRWVVDQFLREKAAVMVSGEEDLKDQMKHYLDSPILRATLEAKSKGMIEKYRGALERNLKYMEPFL